MHADVYSHIPHAAVAKCFVKGIAKPFYDMAGGKTFQRQKSILS